MKVKANSNSEFNNIPIKELGRVAKAGEIFEIPDNRVESLVNGKNFFKMPFVEIVKEREEEPVEMEKPSKAIKEVPKERPVEKPIPEEVKPKKKARKAKK